MTRLDRAGIHGVVSWNNGIARVIEAEAKSAATMVVLLLCCRFLTFCWRPRKVEGNRKRVGELHTRDCLGGRSWGESRGYKIRKSLNWLLTKSLFSCSHLENQASKVTSVYWVFVSEGDQGSLFPSTSSFSFPSRDNRGVRSIS